MIKNTVITFFLIGINGAFAQESKSNTISKIFNEIGENTSCTNPNMILFLNAFPSSFKELNLIYGWDDEKNVRRELYDVAEKHLELFGKTYDCSPKQWTLKSIKIALNGKWDADAVNYFKGLLEDKLSKNPKMYFYYLSKFTEKENISFWKFLIDNPFKNKDIISTFEKIATQDNKQLKYFKAAVRLKWGK